MFQKPSEEGKIVNVSCKRASRGSKMHLRVNTRGMKLVVAWQRPQNIVDSVSFNAHCTTITFEFLRIFFDCISKKCFFSSLINCVYLRHCFYRFHWNFLQSLFGFIRVHFLFVLLRLQGLKLLGNPLTRGITNRYQPEDIGTFGSSKPQATAWI